MDAVKFLNSRRRTCDSYPGCNGCELKGKPCPGYVTYNPIFATHDERVKPNENVAKKESAGKQMDAVKFIKERDRMCRFYHHAGDCYQCPAKDCECSALEGMVDDDNIVAIVKEWSAAHPHKTRQSVFLEQWPNAMKDSGGTVLLCKRNFDVTLDCKHDVIGECDRCRREFWMQEVE